MYYNRQQLHSALADRTPAALAALYRTQGRRIALSFENRALGVPRQGFASSTEVTLHPGRRGPENPRYEREALLRTAEETKDLYGVSGVNETHI